MKVAGRAADLGQRVDVRFCESVPLRREAQVPPDNVDEFAKAKSAISLHGLLIEQALFGDELSCLLYLTVRIPRGWAFRSDLRPSNRRQYTAVSTPWQPPGANLNVD